MLYCPLIRAYFPLISPLRTLAMACEDAVTSSDQVDFFESRLYASGIISLDNKSQLLVVVLTLSALRDIHHLQPLHRLTDCPLFAT
jgi:hypothetical protein